MPTVALCIPAYNAANYLPRLFASVAKQQYSFDEIIVYDDCSTDNTSEVASRFGAKVIRASENRGCSYGRLKLAESTKSDWIHFHDADDDMGENFMSLVHKWLNKDNLPDVILFNYEWIDSDTNELLGTVKFDPVLLEADPIGYCINYQINPFCGLYNKSRFLEAGGPDLRDEMKNYEDAAMHFKLANHGLSFSSEPEIAIYNLRISNSMSRKVSAYKNSLHCQFFYMKEAHTLYGNKYLSFIKPKLWQYCRNAAWVSEWNLLSEILSFIKRHKIRIPENESKLFQNMCKVSPYFAVIVRKFINRSRRKKDTYWY